METDGGAFGSTTTETPVDWPIAPKLSVAIATSVNVPAGALVHVTSYGLVVSVPTGTPFA